MYLSLETMNFKFHDWHYRLMLGYVEFAPQNLTTKVG